MIDANGNTYIYRDMVIPFTFSGRDFDFEQHVLKEITMNDERFCYVDPYADIKGAGMYGRSHDEFDDMDIFKFMFGQEMLEHWVGWFATREASDWGYDGSNSKDYEDEEW